MKMKPTITVADNGNLQIHIPMLIRRMRGRKTVIAPQALDDRSFCPLFLTFRCISAINASTRSII